MQHWLKGISPSSDPFSEDFENILRTNSSKRSSSRHVSDTAQELKTADKDRESSAGAVDQSRTDESGAALQSVEVIAQHASSQVGA